jgi:glutathione S-transferase
MPPILLAHPFSSYCQTVLIALYENETPFTFRTLDRSDPAAFAELEALWPLKRFPLLVDAGRPIAEATIIIEHLELKYPGPVRLIPDDPTAALEVRFIDRFFDNYMQAPLQKIVSDSLCHERERDEGRGRGPRHARSRLWLA